MSTPELYGGIGSLIVGILFVAFPKPIGVAFGRIGKSIWKRRGDDIFGQIRREVHKAVPQISPDRIYDEKHAAKVFRFLGVVFLMHAVVFFILSAVV